MESEEDRIKRFFYDLEDELSKYYRNHKRLATHIIVNSETCVLLQQRSAKTQSNEYNRIYYQCFVVAVDNGLKKYEVKVAGD